MTYFLLPKTKKNIKKKEVDRAVDFPGIWQEFAKLCDIRGGQGIQKFNPYSYQIELINLIEITPTTVITKTRQLGYTEAIANYFLWKACRDRGYLAVIFSKTQTDTSNIAKRVRRHIDSLNIKTKTNALTDIELVGGGRILFRNSTPNGARGLEAVHDILFDEVGFVKEIDEIYKAALPCTTVLGDRARIILLSTPSGQSGFYWDKLSSNNGDRDLLQVCEDIKAKKIEPVQYWHDTEEVGKFLCHWLAHPEFSKQKETYLESVKKKFQLSDAAVQQEYNLSFAEGEQLVFNPQLVRERAVGQWESAIEGEVYYCGMDSSLMGSDYTVFTVLKKTDDNNYSLVALYRQRQKTNAYHCYQIGEIIKEYNPISIAIEVNSGGRIYYEQLSTEFVNHNFIEIKTTGSSKPAMVNKLLLALETGALTYPNDNAIVKEFLSFRKDDHKLEAVSGGTDDILMSLCFAVAISPISFHA